MSDADASPLARHQAVWELEPDGVPFRSPSSWLQPVRWRGSPAILKVPLEPEERAAIPVLPWYEGDGAARVLRWDDHARLIERLADDVSLVEMAEQDRDNDATRILCDVVAKLHRPRSKPPPDSAIPIRRRFRDLERMAAAPGKHQKLLEAAWQQAQELIAGDNDSILLHGDIHHENVLHDPDRCWVAIDPKGVLGPRGYDYANILLNPWDSPIVHVPGRLDAQATIVAAAAGLTRREVLQWVLAHAALSASWSLSDGDTDEHSLKVATMAEELLRAA